MATELDRLTVVFDANIQKLESQLKKVDKALYGTQANAQKWAKANDNTFGAFAKGKASEGLDALAGRAPAAAAGLDKLGAAGLGVAAVLGGLALAINQASAAMDFADDLSDTSKRLHITTDALQEYRYALKAAGGEERDADVALEAFSVTLGNAQAGMSKAVKAFAALGITDKQLDSFADADDALRFVTERIEGLEKDSEKDAILKRLGLEKMKPLILDGVDGLEQLRQKARDVGVVMDSSLVERAAAAKDEFETLKQVVDIQLKSAFVDLAPVLTGLLGILANISREVADIIDDLRSVENKSMRGLHDRRARIVDEIASFGPDPVSWQQDVIRNRQAELIRLDAAIGTRTPLGAAASARSDAAGGPSRLLNTGKEPKGTKDDPVQVRLDNPEDIIAVDPTTGKDLPSYASRADKAFRESIQADPGEARDDPFAGMRDFDPNDQIGVQIAEAAEEARLKYREGVYEGVLDGLNAAVQGNGLDFLADTLRRKLLEAAADALTTAFLNAQSSAGSGGGFGGIVSAALGSLGIPGFANGTNYAPGGLALVGERGPELVNLPRGSKVTPNHRMAAMGGGTTIVQPFHFHAEGAVLTKDILAQADARARQHATTAARQMGTTVLNATPGRLLQQDRLGS